MFHLFNGMQHNLQFTIAGITEQVCLHGTEPQSTLWPTILIFGWCQIIFSFLSILVNIHAEMPSGVQIVRRNGRPTSYSGKLNVI